MSRAFTPLLVLALSLPLGAACGGDDDGGSGDDDGGAVDAGGDDGGDDGEPDAAAGCVPTDVLENPYRPIASVSAGKLTATPGKDITEAVVDARAGGVNAADNPYLYIDLVAGTKVEIDDVAALTSSDWDVAFKRSSIKGNGGDSGPGEVAVASVAGAIEEVTEAPDDAAFVTDDWVSDDCQYQSIPGGEPNTAFGEWYEYNLKTHQLTPKAVVWVVRTHSGDLVKLAIDSFYGDETDPDSDAIYHVAWAPL